MENVAHLCPASRMTDPIRRRRYVIEIKDPDNKPVLFTAVDWTDEERLIAVTQIMRLAGLPDDNWSPGDKPGREVPEPDSLGG